MASLIIAGSRNIEDYEVVRLAVEESGWWPQITEIVSGGARGVDRLGERLAKRNNMHIRIFPADWLAYGKSAGYKRNCDMAEYADFLVAVWDGQSRGTQHMINIMKNLGKPVYIKNV